MYINPCRRRGIGVAGARARLVSAGTHDGTLAQFLRRHELEAAAAARGDAATKQSFAAKLLTRTADSRNLRLAWDHLAHQGGQAPGIDGLQFNDLEDYEVWHLVRTLRRAILDGSYRTAPDRIQRIPKASGRGTRKLLIPTIIDRTVQRAIVQTLQPFLDPLFDEHCLGYRPSSDLRKALAMAKRLLIQQDRWTLLTEDLKDAFDNVPQRRLLDIIRIHVPHDPMMQLIETVVITDTGKGLRQGGNLSPLLLNLYLDHMLDRKWRERHPDVPLLRWADDLLVLCSTTEEAVQFRNELVELLLPAEMSLKTTSEPTVNDLKIGEHADWLGYRLSRQENELKVDLTERAWTHLAENLELVHDKPNSPIRAKETIFGWVTQRGPCFPQVNIRNAYARIRALAHNLALDEIPSKGQIRRRWFLAYLR